MKILHKKDVKRFYVKYFNGFSLQKESSLFESYLNKNEMTVAGFSYGAQQAFEYVYHTKERIERLILLSPAFFQTKKKSFIRAQLQYYEKDRHRYMEKFLQNIQYPAAIELSEYLKNGNKHELEALLHYRWSEEKLKELLERKIEIEVFLGSKDKIIDTNEVAEFFSITTTYIIKDAGHLLKGKL